MGRVRYETLLNRYEMRRPNWGRSTVAGVFSGLALFVLFWVGMDVPLHDSLFPSLFISVILCLPGIALGTLASYIVSGWIAQPAIWFIYAFAYGYCFPILGVPANRVSAGLLAAVVATLTNLLGFLAAWLVARVLTAARNPRPPGGGSRRYR